MDNKNKEIDLIEVFNIIINKIYKNKFLFVSIVIVFVILGFLYNSSKKETYTLSVYATSSINRIVLDNFINDINIKNSEEKKIIPKLEKVSISYDESNENNVFEVEVVFNDTLKYKNTILQIYKVLNEVKYVKEYVNGRKESVKLKINNYLEEIEKINKIQDRIFKPNDSKSTIILTNGLSEAKIEFENEMLILTKELQKITVLNVIHNKFDHFTTNDNKLRNIIFFMFLGAFLATLVAFIKK